MNLESVISVIVPLLPLIIALASFLYKFLLEKLPSSKQAQIESVVEIAVHAVEQIALANKSMDSADKKALAMTMISKALGELHVSVPASLVDMLVEQSVFLLNQQGPEVKQLGFASNK